MPTPSSHQLPNQTSPPSYTFSTCPDDLPHPSRSGREAYDATRPLAPEMEVRPGSSTSITSPTTILSDTSSDGPATDDRPMVASHPMTDESSSRATTSSPRPQSSATSVTSPAPSRLDGDDSVKNQGLGIDHHMGRESVSQTRRLPIETPTSPNREVDSLDMQEDEFCSPYMGPDCSSLRVIPISPSSYLRAGSRFCGTQQSERQVYEVQVEIKHVDMRESFLCGYLRIQGLTEDHPTLTTYFEGEIIGSKYSFFTQHDDWGANAKVDLSHWSKFSAFRPFQKYARKGTVNIHDVAQRDHIFMRWKEHFLVPDHRVRTITGASFEGFYYICFNQLKGEVSGIYFHSKSEKFQQLELKHVPDRGCISATEFR